MAGGGCGLCPGRQNFVMVEEVGSGCNIEGIQGQTLLMGGVRVEGRNENIQKNG